MAPRTCPGTVGVAGLGQAALINTKPKPEDTAAQQIEVQGDSIIAHFNGRAYFGDTCAENTYANNYYKGFPLLGNTLKYTIDMSGAGCGCNAAVYLVSMRQNTDVGTCDDYYCDANSVCGVKCTELDIMEANMYAFRSTLHTADDRGGKGFGYGGTGNLASSWADGQYGPGGQCIDTQRPFQVAVSFPANPDNTLQSMQVTLTQDGSPCPLSGQIGDYQANGVDGFPEITKALSDGMTPVVSFWGADDMTWLDGKGAQGGACDQDIADQCPDSVRVYGISFEKGANGYTSVTPASAPAANNIIAPVAQAPAAATPPAYVAPVDDPLWAAYPGKDAFGGQNANDMEMNAGDLTGCRQYALANGLSAFVVWQGKAYFRSQTGTDVLQNLVDNNEHTVYILKSTLPSSSYSEIPQVSIVPDSPAAASDPAVQVGGLGVPEPQDGYIAPGWYQTEDATSGKYYYNPVTGETSWTRPQ
jgi:hypothetical protein